MAGPSPLWFKQAQRGLYARRMRLAGNHVSPSKAHVKRVWLPNVQRKALWSEALGRSVSLNVTTAALRNMDRVGGLDEYILRTTPAKLASAKGESLRKQITWANGVKANLLALNAAGAAPGSAPAQGAPPTLQ